MSNVSYTGILKLSLDAPALRTVLSLWESLPSEAKPLSVEHLHVTLIHQKLLKPFKQFFSGLELSEGPSVQLMDRVQRIERPTKTSWIALVKNQSEMREYVELLSEMLRNATGAELDENRVFHVSLANLDGSPFASVGDVSWDDVTEAVVR